MNNNKKPTPKKGPIRTEAVVPILVISILSGLYFSILFDSNLRSALQFAGTQIHGAEVNIGSLKTSFLKASLSIKEIEITNKENPSQNLLKIGNIQFKALWDGLLRGKIVIDKAAIEQIELYSPRKYPGKIIPADKRKESSVGKLENSVLEQTKESYNNNILGDVANIADGANPSSQLKDIQNSLKSEEFLATLEKELKDKEEHWKKRLQSLPQKKEFDALAVKAKALKFNSKDPISFANDLKALEKILKEGDHIVKTYEQTNKDLNSDVKTIDGSIKSLDQLVKKDIADLQKRMNIPTLDTKAFSMGLFGKLFGDKVAGLSKYAKLAEEYMPPKKSKTEKQEDQLVPRKRGAGISVKFPITTSYPLFWLKQGVVSSKASNSEYSGDVTGRISDVTSNPVHLQKPTVLELEGDFPKLQIHGFKAKAILDHTKEVGRDTLTATIDHFPVDPKTLSSSDSLKLSITKADGNSNINALYTEGKINAKIINQFTKVEYGIESPSSSTKQIVSNIVNDLPAIDITVKASGKPLTPNLSISSNLGDELANGFKKQISAKIKEAQDQLNKLVQDKIGAQKKKVEDQLSGIKDGVGKNLGAQTAQIKSQQSSVEGQLKGKQNEAKNSATKNIEKEAKKLLKGLGL